MNIYLYDKNTKEYLGTKIADSNPEETKIQGKFIPLIPANATLTPPPEFQENEIPVFNNGDWEVVKDYRRNFVKLDENLNVSEITALGEQDGYFVVAKDYGINIRDNRDKYKISEGEIVEKTPEEIAEEEIQARRAEFRREFFETSLGWIRRRVTMKDGSKKDFLSDLLPAIKAGIELGQPVKIIAYNEPDFRKPEQNIENVQKTVFATSGFVTECLGQLVEDFGI